MAMRMRDIDHLVLRVVDLPPLELKALPSLG